MKTTIFACLLLLLADFGIAHIEGTYVPPEPQGPLEAHSLPLTNQAQAAIQDIIGHLDCEIDEYFLMVGIGIPKGGSCVYNKKKGRIEFKLDRPHSEIALMLVGDLLLFCADEKVTKTQILERYAFAGHPLKSWSRVWMNPEDYANWKPPGQQDDDEQPATAPESKMEGKQNPKPKSEARSQ